MSRFNFTGLYAIIKALHSTTTKDDTKAVIVSDKLKNDTTIEFKNGSYINVLTPKEGCVRGNRSKIIYPLYNGDGTADCHFDKKVLDEVLAPFCKERENSGIDGKILYVSSKGEKVNMKLKETIELMNSENYHDRFKAEYYQLVIRYKRLVKIMQMWDEGTLEFEPNCPRGTYNLQMKYMADYIAVLESRAAIEGIELEDIEVESH